MTILLSFEVQILADRKCVINSQFPYEIVFNQIESPTLLSLINLYIPSRITRNNAKATMNYLKNDTIRSLLFSS